MRGHPLSERATRVLREAVDRDRAVKRHLEPSWPEWSLRELARYFYALGVFALIVFGALQIGTLATGWIDPGICALEAAYVVGVFYFGARAYGLIWGNGGWVDRFLARRGLPPAPPESPARDR